MIQVNPNWCKSASIPLASDSLNGSSQGTRVAKCVFLIKEMHWEENVSPHLEGILGVAAAIYDHEGRWLTLRRWQSIKVEKSEALTMESKNFLESRSLII